VKILTAEMKMENEKLAASVTNTFKADHEKLRQEISLEVKTGINNRTKEIELLRKYTEKELCKISDNIDTMSTNIDERLTVHVSNTRKELATSEHKINRRSRALVKEINYHKLHIDAAVEVIGQRLTQTKEEVNSRVECLVSEVKNSFYTISS
jgi:transcription elongation factor Elf1